MVKKCQYDAENVVVTFFGRFSAKEDFPNFREDGLAQGYKKRASIIHLVNTLTWKALVSTEVRSGQKAQRNGIWEQHSYRQKKHLR